MCSEKDVNNSITSYLLINEDCLKAMKQLPDNSIDLVLTDLPYGTSACKWDNVIPFDEMWNELNRLIKKDRAIVLFGSEPFSSKLRLSNINDYKYDWKWEKPNGANFLNVKYQPSKVHEDIMVFGKMATSYSKNGNMIYKPQMEEGKPYKSKSGKQKLEKNNSTVRSKLKEVVIENEGTRYPRSVIRFGKDKEKLHPTQKPIALLEYLIKTYSNENDVILDFTMGSGSTGVACLKTNRKFIGTEIDKEYFDIAKNRIENYCNNCN